MPSSAVIIPSTGAPGLLRAVRSVLDQTVATRCHVVCDGPQYSQQVSTLLQGLTGTPHGLPVSVCHLPANVGAGGYYGHRIYAAFSHLVDEDFVFFLDQDNAYQAEHVASCVALAESRSLGWVYSLRNIVDPDGSFICRDDCESLGQWPSFTGVRMVDTSAFCVRRRVLIKTAQWWHGKWGQDRVFTKMMMRHVPKFACTGRYTLDYTLGGNAKSAPAEFFRTGNRLMRQQYGDRFPWQETITAG